MHISGTFKAPKEVNIDAQKANIESQEANIESRKANIEKRFTSKTADHVLKLLTTLSSQTVFGRSDVQRVLGLKPTRSSALIREMVKQGIIEPVPGYGKGKYHFL
ncbi:MAG: hypothetical protein LUI14_00400 [Lachnospiraceae bacterium]|nr:hypothetical protein [Lachnospiraceae bacterium]